MKTNNNVVKKKKDKRTKLLIVGGISLFTVLGGTRAYFTTSSTIKDIFNEYGVEFSNISCASQTEASEVIEI